MREKEQQSMGVLQLIWVPLIDYGLRIAVAVVILLRSRGNPTVRLAWLMLVMAFPVAGFLLYLAIGEVRLGRQRVAGHAQTSQAIDAVLTPEHPVQNADAVIVPAVFRRIAYLAESGGGVIRAGNTLNLFGDSDECIDSLIADIREARHQVAMEFYIYLTDATGTRVADALMDAAGRGVRCRLLVDAVGSVGLLRSSLVIRMREAGVEVEPSLPVSVIRMFFSRMDIRNHRKIAVIDGRIGYVGSQNVVDADFAPKSRYAPWRDAMVRIVGPAAFDLNVLFTRDWCAEHREEPGKLLQELPESKGDSIVQIMGSGPTSNNTVLRNLLQTVCHTAEEELIITTPYFVPDEGTMSAIISAATSGIATILIVPARNDSPLVAAASRSFYEQLLTAGVAVHEYNNGLLHSKTMTIDRRFALISTANMDRRSFEINFEVSMVVHNTDFASQLRLLQMSYLNDSTPLTLMQWQQRPWPKRIAENAIGMLGPLL